MSQSFLITLEEATNEREVRKNLNQHPSLDARTITPTSFCHNGVILTEQLLEDYWNIRSGYRDCNCADPAQGPPHLPWRDLPTWLRERFAELLAIQLSYSLDEGDFFEQCADGLTLDAVRTRCQPVPGQHEPLLAPGWLLEVTRDTQAVPDVAPEAVATLVHILQQVMGADFWSPPYVIPAGSGPTGSLTAGWSRTLQELEITVKADGVASYEYRSLHVQEWAPVTGDLSRLRHYVTSVAEPG